MTDDRNQLIEAALLEYIERFGLHGKARKLFLSADHKAWGETETSAESKQSDRETWQLRGG